MISKSAKPQFTSQVVPKSQITMRTYPMKLLVHHFEPKPEEFHIRDIASSLGKLCRFMGHVPWHYSEAQHSLYVEWQTRQLWPDAPPDVLMWALLHDAADAYWGDLHSHAKRKIRGYQKAYKHLAAVLLKSFGLDESEPVLVKKADGIILSTELVQLKGSRPHIEPALTDFKIPRWSPSYAEKRFLKRFEEIDMLRKFQAAWKETYEEAFDVESHIAVGTVRKGGRSDSNVRSADRKPARNRRKVRS